MLLFYLVEGLLHEADAALVDGLTIGEEALLQRGGHGGEALQQREQVLVVILQHVPLLDEGRHQQVDILGLVEVVAHAVRQGADGVVQDEEVLVLVFVEREHQRLDDEAEVGHQLGARLLLQGGEG